MTRRDWLALGILMLFFVAGSPRPWLRRTRVTALIVLFLGLELQPWLTGAPIHAFVMPFAYYRLYTTPPRAVIQVPELRMVTSSGAEHPIDVHLWQPLIPRYVNVLLQWKLGARLDPATADALLARVKDALRGFHERGHLDPPNGYLLGPLHYPEHQTGAWRWQPGDALPQPEDVVAVRLALSTAPTQRPPGLP